MMTNGNNVLEFEECNFEALCAEWVRKYGEEPDASDVCSESWRRFVMDAYSMWSAECAERVSDAVREVKYENNR